VGYFISLFCFILALTVLVHPPLKAQTIQLFTTAYEVPKNPSVEPENSGSAPTAMSQESAARFGKAFWTFFGSDAVQISSKTVLKVSSGEFNVSFPYQNSTIAKKTGQVSTDLEFLGGTKLGRKYRLISDSKNLWIYRPDTKQFSVQTYKQFDDSDDSLYIGLSTGLYLSASEMRQLIPEESPSPQKLQEAGIQDLGQKVSESGKSYQVYALKVKEGNLQFWIDPQTTQIEILRVSVKQKEMQVDFQETILQFQRNIPTQSGRFTFQPLGGAKQVKKISIEPFD
jgi:hypothetical protein